MTSETIKVLVIDDDEDDYILTSELFSLVKSGEYVIDWASSYEEGLTVAARGEHHVCLVDYRLGEHTGTELIREARESRLTTPMILLTGQGDHDIDVEAMEAGATDYLVKDETSPTRLERTIRYAVQLNIERCRAEANLVAYARKQAVVAEIGRLALTGGELKDLFAAAVRLVTQTLGVKYCKVLELGPEGETFILKAAVGWQEADPLVGPVISVSQAYQPGFTLLSDAPVVIEDLRTETRFGGLPDEQGVVSGMSVAIRGRKSPYGVLSAHTEERRSFVTDEINFMVAVANVLAEAGGRKRADEEDVARLLGLNSDLSERKRVEEALRKSEERFQLVIRATKDTVWDWDLVTDQLWWNEGFQTMFGYQADEVGSDINSWTRRLHPDDLRWVSDGIHEAIESGQHSWSGEYRFRRADGSYAQVANRGYVVHDELGKPVRMLGSMMDVTERERANETLRNKEAQLGEAQRIARLGSWEWDTVLDKVTWSDELYRIFGLQTQDFSGTYEAYLQHIYPEDLAYVTTMIENSLREGGSSEYSHRIIRQDGTVRAIHAHASVTVNGSGSPVKMMGTAQDITEQKQMEEDLKKARDAALESVRLKSEFLANMSHEIRTPMNGVMGMTSLLSETDLSPRQREYTETIQFSADALLTIIDDILDFSKIEAGLLRFEKIDFELRGTVESTVESLAERAQAKGLELASLVYQDVPTDLRGDPGRLRQVLTNLVGNAVKFTERGEVVVSVTKVSESATKAMLRFEIQDTGIGISQEAQQRLFRAFTQADGSTTRKYGGTGLGLAISKQLVLLMGGEIGIESAHGTGSIFWFTAQFEKQFEHRTAATPTDGELATGRVLIVDDNATNRHILNHQIGSWGMITAEAESARHALELLRAGVARGEPFDIAVLDLMMPDMDGFQLAEAIKTDPTIASTILVLLPSFGRRGHGERAIQVGIAAYLPKPVRQRQLYDCLSAVMSRTSTPEPVAPTPLVTRHFLRESEWRGMDQNLSRLRILLAEDNKLNQRVVLGQLGNLGYEAEVVANGRELLTALEHDHADIILMDCQMPEMDGFAATAEIRRREGAARHTTIIAMTANAFDSDRENCRAAGMDDYISKPFKSEALRQMLERWIHVRAREKGLSKVDEPAPRQREGVIDQSQLASLRKIRPAGVADFLTVLIDLYLKEVPSNLQALHDAALRGDAGEIKEVAHCLKGSSANIGATHMAALSEALESKDATQDIRQLLVRLDQEFALVRQALGAERKELKR